MLAHSGFSVLDGRSDPEELVAEADRLGLAALALTDHHGFYGVVRFAEAARSCGLPTVFGTEVTLAPASPRTGEPDPTGTHLVLLARDPEGYARLSTVLADAHLAAGQLEQACSVALKALTAGEQIRSARCVNYLREFRQRLTNVGECAAVTEFRAQADDSRLWRIASRVDTQAA